MYRLVSTEELPGGNRVCVHCHSIALSVRIPPKETGFDRVVDLCDCGAGRNFETLLKSDAILYRPIETINEAIGNMVIREQSAAAPLNAHNVTNAELAIAIEVTVKHINGMSSLFIDMLKNHLKLLLEEQAHRACGKRV